MSGTSMDGVDTSLIRSDGYDEFACISDEYYPYSNNLQEELISIRNLIINHEDLFKYSKELNDLERKITVFHGDKVKQISLKYKNEIDLIGFHGQLTTHIANSNMSVSNFSPRTKSNIEETGNLHDFYDVC